MADALKFTTTPKEKPQEGQTPEQAGYVRIEIDGTEYWVRKPKDALVAQLGPALSRRTNALVKVQLSLDFLEDCLAEPGRTLLRDRLMDEQDDFDATDALNVLNGIADYWKAHPELVADRR